MRVSGSILLLIVGSSLVRERMVHAPLPLPLYGSWIEACTFWQVLGDIRS